MTKNWIIVLTTKAIILMTVVFVGSCASTSLPTQSTQPSESPVFEMQTGEDYFWVETERSFYYQGLIPEGAYENYRTEFWDVSDRFVFGLGGPFVLEDGRIPVFVCDVNRRQFFRFGGSVLYCPGKLGGRLKVSLSQNHPHPEGLELRPGTMPWGAVRTLVYIWREDRIDKIGKDWQTTAYCVAAEGTTLAIWCEPYKPLPKPD